MDFAGFINNVSHVIKTDYVVQIALWILAGSLLMFVIFCVTNLIAVSWKFKDAKRLISKEKDEKIVIDSLQKFFSKNAVYARCLDEFTKTLFPIKEISDTGERETAHLKLTESSSLFFDVATIVDNQARTNIFNHLPGIFTSIGIIGTFMGLMMGLQSFSLDVTQVDGIQKSVGGLLDSVMRAFIVSATAILCAVITTVIEKICYQKALTNLNQFVACLDSKFSGCVSNDFMSELLDLTRQNTTQSKQLMDGFVVDLKELLEKNAERQSERISNAILETFSGSLGEVAEAIKQMNGVVGELQGYVSSSQAAAGETTEKVTTGIRSAFQDMRGEIANFSAAIENSSGKLIEVSAGLDRVISGYSKTLAKFEEVSKSQADSLMESSQKTATEFTNTAVAMNGEIKKSVEKMAEQLDERLTKTIKSYSTLLEQTKKASTAQTQEMKEAITGSSEGLVQSVNAVNAALQEKTEAMLNQLNEGMEKTIGGLATLLEQTKKTSSIQTKDMKEAIKESSSEFAQSVGAMNSALRERTEEMMKQLESSLEKTIDSFTLLLDETKEITGTQTREMAEAIQKSSTDFVQTINSANESLKETSSQLMTCQSQFARVARQIDTVSTALEEKTTKTQGMVANFSFAMDKQKANLASLEDIVNNFKDSIGQSDDAILKIYDIVEKIQASNVETSKFAEEAASALESVFAEFQTGTRDVGIAVNENLDKVMSTACSKLESSVRELQSTLDDFSEEMADIKRLTINQSQGK